MSKGMNSLAAGAAVALAARYRRISVFRQKTPHGKETQTQRRKSDESYGRSSRQRVLHDEIVPKTRCAESGGFIFCSRMHIFLVSMMTL